MALTQVKALGIAADSIDESKIADNGIDSEHYNDGSIDTAHIADQAVDLTKLPHGDGTSNGKFLRSNNGADPTWETVTSADTTYSISCVDGDNSDEEKIRLTAGGSGSGTDDVVLEAGTGLSIARDSDKITFTNTVTGGAFTHSGDNIYAGTGAGAALAGGANYNFIAGNGAGADVSTGDHNVCVGNDAGHAVTTGSNNVCIGQKTGYDLDDATGNIHIGYQAGEHTTGNDNVFIGHRAGDADANTSYYNTCIGPYAGKAKPLTGYGNTFVGAESAGGSTGACSGLDNTGIGRATLAKVESGYYNFAGGINALFECTTGDDNVCIGLSAGYSITDGDNNIGLGKQALTSASPSGNITTTDSTLCLGNNSISNFYCADTSISSSDKRDKTDIADFTHGLDWIKKLKPVTYRWDKRTWYSEYNADGSVKSSTTPDGSKKTQRQHIGFLAQDVLEVEKSFGYAGKKDDMLTVNLNEDDTAYGMKYERLVPILVNAIKELEAKVAALEAK